MGDRHSRVKRSEGRHEESERVVWGRGRGGGMAGQVVSGLLVRRLSQRVRAQEHGRLAQTQDFLRRWS